MFFVRFHRYFFLNIKNPAPHFFVFLVLTRFFFCLLFFLLHLGNIVEKAPDAMIRHILATCGHVISWKRVKGFGFCELAGPDAGLRAVRLLHDLMVGEKRLVAKVDAKTKAVLDEYKGNTHVPLNQTK